MKKSSESFKQKDVGRCKLDVVQLVYQQVFYRDLVLRWVWQEDHQTMSKSQNDMTPTELADVSLSYVGTYWNCVGLEVWARDHAVGKGRDDSPSCF